MSKLAQFLVNLQHLTIKYFFSSNSAFLYAKFKYEFLIEKLCCMSRHRVTIEFLFDICIFCICIPWKWERERERECWIVTAIYCLCMCVFLGVQVYTTKCTHSSNIVWIELENWHNLELTSFVFVTAFKNWLVLLVYSNTRTDTNTHAQLYSLKSCMYCTSPYCVFIKS